MRYLLGSPFFHDLFCFFCFLCFGFGFVKTRFFVGTAMGVGWVRVMMMVVVMMISLRDMI